MSSQVADTAQSMDEETVESLQELIHALRDSVNYHREAAVKIDDMFVKQELLGIANERSEICETISGLVDLSQKDAADKGTWLGSLRTIWMSLRAGLNAGDATVILIEAERAEDVIVGKFVKILPEISGNPVNDQLLKYYDLVKSGHDRILALRNGYQSA